MTNLDASVVVDGGSPVEGGVRDGRMADRSEFELAMERCRQGESAPFAVVYDELIGVVWRVIRRTQTKTQNAEQLAVAVFVELWRQVPVFDNAMCSPRIWAVRVAVDIIGRTRDAENGVGVERSLNSGP